MADHRLIVPWSHLAVILQNGGLWRHDKGLDKRAAFP